MRFCNVDINMLKLKDIFHCSSSEELKHIITVNAEGIVRANENSRLLQIMNNNCTTIDGQIPLWLFKRKYPKIDVDKLSGSDIVYDICTWAEEKSYKVFLLGGNTDANYLSVVKLKVMYPKLEIFGFSPVYQPYPFSTTNELCIKEEIEHFSPDILFVGFGMEKQEYWIDDNREFLKSIGIQLVIGCGGTFEFISGKIKRAPLFIQRIGLEGFWRLCCEPKFFRLKRLLISLKIFRYFYS